ncbi:MAG: hypothetical protein ABIH39_03600 [Candidatus Margulisiibacteriota bacterium]
MNKKILLIKHNLPSKIGYSYSTPIDPDQCLKMIVKDDTLYINVLRTVPNGFTLGKAFGLLLETKINGKYEYDITKCSKVILNITKPVDLQFILFYLAWPPDIAERRFGKCIAPEDRNINIKLNSAEAVNQLFNAFGSALDNQFTLLQEAIPFLGSNLHFIAPKTHIHAVKSANIKQSMRQRAKETVKILQNILPYKYYQVLDEVITGHNKSNILTFLDSISFDIEEQTGVSGITVDSPSSIVHPISGFVSVLRGEAVIHMETDGTFLLAVDNNTIRICDAGHDVVVDLIDKITKKSNANSIEFYISHFHYDHTHAFAQSIKKAIDLGLQVSINIPEVVLKHQAVSYFATNKELLDFLAPDGKNLRKGVSINILPEPEDDINNTSPVKMIKMPDALGHFVTSRGYYYKLNDTLIFSTGDMNPNIFNNPKTESQYTEEEVKAGIRECYDNAVKLTKFLNMKKLKLFIDYGHFPPNYKKYMREYWTDLCSRNTDLEMYSLCDHLKDYSNYTFRID